MRSFYDSDGDGIGDLQGLISRLDYLNDGDPSTTSDLGVTGLWLMPVMESPSYHGYDASDYYQIEQDYGSNEDFQQFVDEAHRRGMVVIIDMMLNHTSNLHSWFLDSQTPGSEHDDWYIWRTDDPGYLGPWGEQVWHPLGDRYYYGIFWSGMPDLNYENPEVTAAMQDVARFWLEDMGVDGFRLDAVRHLIEDGQTQANTPQTHEWLEGFFAYVKSVNPDALLVGEVWDSPVAIRPYIGGQLDIAFEFTLAETTISAIQQGNGESLAYTQQQVLDAYPPGQYAAFLTNHDQARVMTQLLSNEGEARAAATLLLTNPGMPFIYYGEEIGMTGRKPDENIRTPMQWDSTPVTAGFTTGTPWIAAHDDVETSNVAAQSADPASLLNHYRALIALRNQESALRIGDFLAVESDSRRVYAFLRFTADDVLLVVVNLSDEAVSDYHLSFAEGPLAGQPGVTLLFGEGEPAAPSVNASGGFDSYVPLPELAPYASLVIRLDTTD